MIPTKWVFKNFVRTLLERKNFGSMDPKCSHEEKFADRIPPRAPPSSRKAGITVKRPAICTKLSILVLRMLPEVVLKIPQKIKTGTDSIIILLEYGFE